MNDDERVKVDQALKVEFPQKLRYAIEHSYLNNISDYENKDLNKVLERCKDKIADIIKREMNCSLDKAYSISENIFNTHKREISDTLYDARQKSLENTADNVFDVTKERMSMVEQIPDLVEQVTELKSSCRNIVLFSEHNLSEQSRKERLSYFRKLEDIVMTKMKSEFKTELMHIDEKRGEYLIQDVSHTLYNNLIAELENSYEVNTKRLNKTVSKEVEKCAVDVTNYYCSIAGPAYNRQKEENMKKDETKEKLDLSGLVKSSEEIVKKDIENMGKSNSAHENVKNEEIEHLQGFE